MALRASLNPSQPISGTSLSGFGISLDSGADTTGSPPLYSSSLGPGTVPDGSGTSQVTAFVLGAQAHRIELADGSACGQGDVRWYGARFYLDPAYWNTVLASSAEADSGYVMMQVVCDDANRGGSTYAPPMQLAAQYDSGAGRFMWHFWNYLDQSSDTPVLLGNGYTRPDAVLEQFPVTTGWVQIEIGITYSTTKAGGGSQQIWVNGVQLGTTHSVKTLFVNSGGLPAEVYGKFGLYGTETVNPKRTAFQSYKIGDARADVLPSAAPTPPSIVRYQGTPDYETPSFGTVDQAFSSPVTSGSLLHATVFWDSSTGARCTGVVDSLGNTWTQAVAAVTDTADSTSAALWNCTNAKPGATTVQASFSVPVVNRGLVVEERVMAVPVVLRAATGQAGLNAVVTDSMTSGVITAGAGDIVIGSLLALAASGAPVAGSGFTGRQSASSAIVTEDLIQQAAGQVAATFTNTGAAQHYIAFVAAYKAAASIQSGSSTLALSGTGVLLFGTPLHGTSTLALSGAGVLTVTGYGSVSTNPTIAGFPEPGNRPPRILIQVSSLTGPSVRIMRIGPDGQAVPVRSGDPATLNSAAWIGYDYEAPYNAPVVYEAFPVNGVPSVVVAPAVTLKATRPWLVHPGVPSLSQPVTVKVLDDETMTSSGALHEVLGRDTPIPVTDGRRKTAAFTTLLKTATAGEATALEQLFYDTAPLLLQVLYPNQTEESVYRWVYIGDITQARKSTRFGDQSRIWTLPCREVSRPVGGIQSQRTWAVVMAECPTWADVMARYRTWRGVLTGIAGT